MLARQVLISGFPPPPPLELIKCTHKRHSKGEAIRHSTFRTCSSAKLCQPQRTGKLSERGVLPLAGYLKEWLPLLSSEWLMENNQNVWLHSGSAC